jgi:hypothetical protein
VFGEDIKNQFDVNFEAKPYAQKWETLNVNFTDDGGGLSGDLIPDISEHNGRLFLSQKAYGVLKDLFVEIRVREQWHLVKPRLSATSPACSLDAVRRLWKYSL